MLLRLELSADSARTASVLGLTDSGHPWSADLDLASGSFSGAASTPPPPGFRLPSTRGAASGAAALVPLGPGAALALLEPDLPNLVADSDPSRLALSLLLRSGSADAEDGKLTWQFSGRPAALFGSNALLPLGSPAGGAAHSLGLRPLGHGLAALSADGRGDLAAFEALSADSAPAATLSPCWGRGPPAQRCPL